MLLKVRILDEILQLEEKKKKKITNDKTLASHFTSRDILDRNPN
jgi:hypothetical protein